MANFWFLLNYMSSSWFWCVCQKHQNTTEERLFHWNTLLVSEILENNIKNTSCPFYFKMITYTFILFFFCISCTKHNNQPQTWYFQDGSRGGDVRDVQGPSIRLQGWYLVTWGDLDWAGADWTAQSWDEPNESPAENSKVGSSYPDATVTLVSMNLSVKSLYLFMLYFYIYLAWSI